MTRSRSVKIAVVASIAVLAVVAVQVALAVTNPNTVSGRGIL